MNQQRQGCTGRRPMVTGMVVVCAWVAMAVGARSQTAELTILATGFGHARGHAVAKLFAPGDDVLRQGRWQAASAIKDGAAAFTFPALPPGDYAAVVFHDENGNGVIDHNAVGIPVEPLGFSNGFRLGLTSGLPSFEKLRFRLGPGPTRLSIPLR